MTDTKTTASLMQTTASLIEQGYLVPTKLFVRPAVLEHELHAGSVVAAYQSTCAGKRVIVFANTVLHAEFLAAQFNAAGIVAYTLLARDNRAVRTAAIESFSVGTCMVLVTINIDLAPSTADGVIIATQHNSARRYEHQIVSAMRPRFAPSQEGTDAMRRAAIASSGKPVAMILDLAENYLRHPEVIASVTHRAKPDAHLTIPGSLEWDQTPAAADSRASMNDVTLLGIPLNELMKNAADPRWQSCDAPRAPLDCSAGGAGEIARLRAEVQEWKYRAENPAFTGRLDSWQAACGKARGETESLRAQLTEVRALLATTNYSASRDCHNAQVVGAACDLIDKAIAQ